MRENIFKSSYAEYSLNQEDKTLYAVWFPDSEMMTGEEFKHEMTHELSLIEKYQVKKYLIDVTEFRFTIGLELQEWSDKNVNLVLDNLGLRKLAYVTSEDFIAQLSIEQTMDESEKENYQTQFFASFEEAQNWLSED